MKPFFLSVALFVAFFAGSCGSSSAVEPEPDPDSLYDVLLSSLDSITNAIDSSKTIEEVESLYKEFDSVTFDFVAKHADVPITEETDKKLNDAIRRRGDVAYKRGAEIALEAISSFEVDISSKCLDKLDTFATEMDELKKSGAFAVPEIDE